MILYQQLTGRLPFQMEPPSLPEFFELIMNNDPPRFRDAAGDGRVSSLAEEMEAVILRCLSKNPHARVASVREILETFEEVSGQTGPGHQNVMQDLEESEKSLRGGINQNGPDTEVAEQQEPSRKLPDTQTDLSEVPPVDQQTLKPEMPKQHISHDDSDRLDSSRPVNATLTPDAASNQPGHLGSQTMPPVSNENAVRKPSELRTSEEDMTSASPFNPERRQQAGFPIGKISAALVVSAVVFFAVVLYPLIHRNRLEIRFERALENSAYAQAAETVEEIDFLTQLWVNRDVWKQKIRETGNQKARDFADDGSWNDAITECVLLNEVFPGDSESRQILEEIVETIEHQVEKHSDENRYRDAVEFLNPNKNKVVKKLVEFDAELISPELLTRQIRSKGLEKINSYLDREQPQEAVRIGMDLQRAFRQDVEVNREVIRARIALHAAKGSRFSKENLFSKAVEEYQQALELASNPSQKSSLTLARARITKDWAEEDQSPNTKPDETLTRFGAVFEDLKFLMDQETPISGAFELLAETFLSRAEFHMKQADSLDGKKQRRQKNENVRSAIGDLHLALGGPLDEEHRNTPKEHLQNIATIYLTDGRDYFLQALNLSENQEKIFNTSTDQEFQASIEALSIAISAQGNEAAGYFFRAGARTHLRQPDFDWSLKDFRKFEQLAQEQLNAGDDSANELFELKISLAKSYSLHAWILATCSEKNLRDGKKALELAKRAEKQFDALEGKLPDADWLMARSDVFKSKSAAYAQMGDFEKAITTTERILADLTAPKTDKAKADYTSEEVEWTLHKILLEKFYKQKRIPPFRFR
ncbi:MAG: hypothetical protein IH899_13370 [Planctomycetes bacterium]|nr:hypothetical protein [Planctomycetota bacterium]